MGAKDVLEVILPVHITMCLIMSMYGPVISVGSEGRVMNLLTYLASLVINLTGIWLVVFAIIISRGTRRQGVRKE